MTTIKKTLQTIAILLIGIANAQTPNTHKGPIVQLVIGPTGQLISPPSTAAASLRCDVNGVTITTSGSANAIYSVPSSGIICTPLATFTGLGNWTGTTTTGFVRYSFSQPVVSVRVGYNAVNSS